MGLNIWWNLNILRDTSSGSESSILVLLSPAEPIPSLCIRVLKVLGWWGRIQAAIYRGGSGALPGDVPLGALGAAEEEFPAIDLLSQGASDGDVGQAEGVLDKLFRREAFFPGLGAPTGRGEETPDHGAEEMIQDGKEYE
jgi:hypothetical protein